MTPTPAIQEEHGVTISFVVIARNEEERISRCLESVVHTSHFFDSTEIVLVDSRSTDSTVEVARKFPIDILVLGPCQPPSPAAGRTVGTHNSRGAYIVYVDGDMILNPHWVVAAMDFMEKNEGFAALSGRLIEPTVKNVATLNSFLDVFKEGERSPTQLQVMSSRLIGGAVLVRRSCLLEAGGLNPYLTGDEEAELSYRLLASGYRIGITSEAMAVHPRRDAPTLKEALRRFRYGYFKGQGKVLKASFRHSRRAFLHHLWRLKLYILYDIWFAIGILSVFIFLLRYSVTPLLLAWFVMTFIGFLALVVRHGLRNVPQRVVSSAFVGLGIIQALVEELPETEDFPTDTVRRK